MTPNQNSPTPLPRPAKTGADVDPDCNTSNDPRIATLFKNYTPEQQETIRENVTRIRHAIDVFGDGLAKSVLADIKRLLETQNLQRRDITDTYSKCRGHYRDLQKQFNQAMILFRDIDPAVDAFCLNLQTSVSECMEQLSNLVPSHPETWKQSLKDINSKLATTLAKDVNELFPVFFQMLPTVMNPTSDNPAKP